MLPSNILRAKIPAGKDVNWLSWRYIPWKSAKGSNVPGAMELMFDEGRSLNSRRRGRILKIGERRGNRPGIAGDGGEVYIGVRMAMLGLIT